MKVICLLLVACITLGLAAPITKEDEQLGDLLAMRGLCVPNDACAKRGCCTAQGLDGRIRDAIGVRLSGISIIQT